MTEPSVFEFSDELGSDPVMRRYRRVGSYEARGSEMDLRIALADKEIAKAKFEAAQAELSAQLAPMKFAQDQFKSMADMVKTKSELEETAAVQRGATVISDGLSKAKNLDEVISLGSNNSLGLRDSVVGAKWRVNVLGGFRQLIDNAQSVAEVQAAHAKLPASIAFEPEFKGLYDNGLAQAEKREEVRRSFAAEPSLGTVPTTATGGVDVTAAGLAIAAKGGEKAREKETKAEIEKRIDNIRQSYSVVSKRLTETPLGAVPDPQLVALKNSLELQLIDYSRSLIGEAQPPGAAGGSDWTADLIPPGVTVPPTKPTVQDGTGTVPTVTAEPTPTDSSVPTPTVSTEPTTTTAPAPIANRTKTAAELRTAQKRIDTLTKELNSMKEASGLAKQPWGIRQINEALSSDNAKIRAKAQELRQAQLDINPLADADVDNAQDVAAALELVYPEIGDGLTPKFDVGNPKDNRVMAAAMFLQKVRPEFLKMVASSPGVNKGGLSLKEIGDIVRNQPSTTGKRTTRR